jgi:hypothetical protein
MRRLGALVAVLFLFSAPAWAEGFLTAYEDLPLAPGLAEDTGAALSFDSPGGRIVDALARGAVKPTEVLKFYAATLPQLGWSRESDTVWRREAEVLRIEAGSEGRGSAVRFHVSPE